MPFQETLFDVSMTNDAIAAGYEEPEEGGLKIRFEDDRYVGPCIYLSKCGHVIDLYGAAEIKEVIRALQTALTRTAAKSVQVAEAA